MRVRSKVLCVFAAFAMGCGAPPGESDELETACDPCADDETCVIHLNFDGTLHSAECEPTTIDCDQQCSDECETSYCSEHAECGTYCDRTPGAFVCCYP